MLDLQITPGAESVYAERAAALGQTVNVYLNQTSPNDLVKNDFVFITDHHYLPTVKEQEMIAEGEADFAAGQYVTIDEAFAAAHQAIWQNIN